MAGRELHSPRQTRDGQPGERVFESGAINKINITMAADPERRSIARGAATIGMTSRIARSIGFGLDDTPGQPPGGMRMHHHFTEQIARQFNTVGRQFGAA